MTSMSLHRDQLRRADQGRARAYRTHEPGGQPATGDNRCAGDERVGLQALVDRQRVNATRDEAAKRCGRRGALIGVHRQRVPFPAELDDLGGGDPVRPEFEHRSLDEILRVQSSRHAFSSVNVRSHSCSSY